MNLVHNICNSFNIEYNKIYPKAIVMFSSCERGEPENIIMLICFYDLTESTLTWELLQQGINQLIYEVNSCDLI